MDFVNVAVQKPGGGWEYKDVTRAPGGGLQTADGQPATAVDPNDPQLKQRGWQ